MMTIHQLSEASELTDNTLIAGSNVLLENSEISFTGTGNILFIEDGAVLKDCSIEFGGSNSVVYLSKNRYEYMLDLVLYHDSVCFFGPDNYFNRPVTAILSEQKHLIVGADNLFSLNVWIRLADPHLLYDTKSRQRINPSKSVWIGDHVWIGQNVIILKGSRIGSGSVCGAMALVTGDVPSNSIVGGNPAKVIRSGIFWSGKCVHRYTANETASVMQDHDGIGIFQAPLDPKDHFREPEAYFSSAVTPEEKLEYIRTNLAVIRDPGRFYIPAGEHDPGSKNTPGGKKEDRSLLNRLRSLF